MLKLTNIVKNYKVGSNIVQALKGVSIEFRKNEFVSILGHSGCGKTTLLNIIGGLDRYTSGDLEINGVSTKKYKNSDWDVYRNKSIGFVFQSYNLIPHQSVLSNVELALTLSGVSRKERRQRAKDALEKVGLGDKLSQKPNQLSGGQMQRVAIARALVNNPEILLADEPTGALDTETSTQIMEILKEVAKDRLVIMVTHNPELAEQYSTRIVKLVDGEIISDSNPFTNNDNQTHAQSKRRRKTSLSMKTALGLSLKNLMTKKARTILTAFAGSIGIIGIALIMSLSNGVQVYISNVERDVLSSYPIQIENQTVDMTSMMESMMGTSEQKNHDNDKVYSNNIMLNMLNSVTEGAVENDLKSFKSWLESDNGKELISYTSAIQYDYNLNLLVYSKDSNNDILKINPSPVVNMIYNRQSTSTMQSQYSMASRMSIWQEMLDNKELMESQYDIVAGKWPTEWNEVVLVVNSNNEVSDVALYSLGLLDQKQLSENLSSLYSGEIVDIDNSTTSFDYNEIFDLEYKLVLPSALYLNEGNTWRDKSNDENYISSIMDSCPSIKIVGIIRSNQESVAETLNPGIAYTSDLSNYIINQCNQSEIVKAQKDNPNVNILNGKEFSMNSTTSSQTFTDEEMSYLMTLSEEERATYISSLSNSGSYTDNMAAFGYVDTENPKAINIYPTDFDSKDRISEIIQNYNDEVTESGNEEKTITYTDYVGLLLTSVTTIVNIVSYVLIAFVSISLVVSSIMIGIITYISVLERTKEIGILRAIGASKRDISKVFNAETIIVGFSAGVIGIGLTSLLNILVNLIIGHFAEVGNLASLPYIGAIFLVLISILLTFIAGLIPARIASKKDPVIALRSE